MNPCRAIIRYDPFDPFRPQLATQLPNEIWVQILQHCDPPTLGRAARVSRRFRALAAARPVVGAVWGVYPPTEKKPHVWRIRDGGSVELDPELQQITVTGPPDNYFVHRFANFDKNTPLAILILDGPTPKYFSDDQIHAYESVFQDPGFGKIVSNSSTGIFQPPHTSGIPGRITYRDASVSRDNIVNHRLSYWKPLPLHKRPFRDIIRAPSYVEVLRIFYDADTLSTINFPNRILVYTIDWSLMFHPDLAGPLIYST